MKATTVAIGLALSFVYMCHLAAVLAVNVIHMSTSRIDSEEGAVTGRHLRRATVPLDLFNNMTGGSGYLVNVKVGTPGQVVSLIVDTGSSDTFVLAAADDQCNDPEIIYNYGACIGGTFDPSASSTFSIIAVGGFRIRFLDTRRSSGDYIADNFEIGGSLISGLQMGLALHSTIGVGIMGIGYQAGESVTIKNRYPNLVDQLVAQKLINLRAYSLYLDDREASSGSILFGGIDTEKFIGTLKVLPILTDPRSNTIDTFIVLMTSLSIIDESGTSALSSSISLPVILDSGTTLTYLPTNVVNAIVSRLGAVDDTNYSSLIFVDCNWRVTRPNVSISFGFGGSNGPVIQVPLSELIRTLRGHYTNSPFQTTCDLGIRAADLNIYLLGDTFLRSAYVVYDLDHDQIALAQTNFEAPGSQIFEIPSGASGIPLMSGQIKSLTQVPESHSTTIKTSTSSFLTHSTTKATGEATLVMLSSSVSSATSQSILNTPTSAGVLISTSTLTSTFEQTIATTLPSAPPNRSAARMVCVFWKDASVFLSMSILAVSAGVFWFVMV